MVIEELTKKRIPSASAIHLMDIFWSSSDAVLRYMEKSGSALSEKLDSLSENQC